MSAQDTAGVTMTYGYDDLGRPTQSIDPRTKGTGPTPLATTTAYLSKTNLVYTITDPAGTVQATYTYDSAGRVNSVMNALGKFARCDYNLLGQKLHEWGDTPNPVLYTYDPNYGWQTKLTTYRAGTGWTGTTWPTATGTGDTTIWAFDPGSGLLLSKTDAASNAVSYSYTQPGQVYTRTWARNIVNTNTKIVTTYDYSSTTGELTGVTYNDGTPSVSYFYNRLGEMASADDATDINAIGTHTFTYNQNGGLELDSENLPAFFNNRLLTYTYDTTNTGTKGRSTGFELGNSANPKADQSVVYGYQLDGRLSSVTGGGRIFTYGYLSNSHLINTVADTTVPTPVTYTDTQKYDAAHDWTASRTTTWGPTTGTPLASFSYTPDIMGRIYQVNKTGALFSIYGAGSLTTKYGYDDRSELTSEKTTDSGNVLLPPRNDSYVFDNMGNRQNPVTHNGNTAIYTPNNLNQYTQRTVPGIFDVTGSAASTATITVNGSSTGVIRDGQYFFDPFSLTNTPNDVFATLNISEGTTNVSLPAFLPAALQKFQYDYDGNLTDDGHWQYTYDAENRLTFMQIDQAALKANVPNQKIAFTYDYLGRRVQKTASNLTGGNWVVQDDRRFIYQGNNLIAEINSNTLAVIKSYYWGLDLSGSGQGAGGVGGLLMAQDSSGSYLPMFDAMGNVHGLIAATSVTLGGTVYPAGSIVAAYEYDASGQTLRESGPYAASNPIGYSTKYTDLETGLIYFGRRYYSPTLGRFINRDPIEEAGGSNLYAFCGNNGVNNLDYLGMDTGQTIDNITYNQAPYDPGSGMSGWLPAFQEALRGFYGAAWSNWSNYLFNLNGPEPWIYLFDNGECGNGPLDRLAASARRDQANYVAAAAAAYNAVHPQAPNSSATTPAQNNDPKNNQDTATGQTRTETDPKTGKTYIVTNDPNYDPTGMTLVAWGTNYGSFSNGSVVRGGSNAGMVAENNGVLGTIGANNTWSSGRTLIMIGYTTVVGRLDHSFTIAIDLATGTQTIGRGGPSSDVDGAFATSWDPWGTILGRFRTWTETPGAFDDPSKTINTQFVGATSANSSSIVNQMVNFAQLVNQNPMLYWPQGPNSNSYTYSLISYLGFTPPTPVHTVPGWGRNIIP
jgi:RHS repeat-associated protein